jgi:hypothetical protein
MARPIEQVLDLARWAPSGDNTQPWRFEIIGADRAIVHGFDTREDCIYDIAGWPSQISLGALLETLRIACTAFAIRPEINPLRTPETHPTYYVALVPDTSVRASPLVPFIATRAVQRRPMRWQALTPSQKLELESSVGPDYTILWKSTALERLAMARLLFASAKIRLVTPEAYEVHRRIIEWRARFSEDRIPDQALGLDRLTLRLMHWAMQDWRRVHFMNTYLGGTVLPRVQLDFLPGIACASHFLIVGAKPPSELEDRIAAGAAMQRFWLTAASLGLQVQPEMTPLIFYWYAREGRTFSAAPGVGRRTERVTSRLERLFGPPALAKAVFMGRVGSGAPPRARSLRRPLSQLIAPPTT